MLLFCYADIRVHDEDTVREWLQDVADAVITYLGNGGMDSSGLFSAKL